jgi:hypothetical protein
VCSDTSRGKYHRLIETREWQLDEKGSFIHNILDEIQALATEYNTRNSLDRSYCSNEIVTEAYMGIISNSENREKLVRDLRISVGSLVAI